MTILKYWDSLSGTTQLIVEVVAGIATILGFAVLVWTTFIFTDKTSDFENQYVAKYEDKFANLDKLLLEANEQKIRAMKSRNEYTDFIISEMDRTGLGADARLITAFFDKVVECDESWTCGVDGRRFFYEAIRNFWLAYGSYVENIRGRLVKQNFGLATQRKALHLYRKE